MKKLILTLALATFVGMAIAQTPKDARQDARQARMEQAIDNMQAALATQNFMFIPSQMSLLSQGSILLNSLSFAPFIDVTPDFLAVNMPYSLQLFPPNTRIFDLYMPNVPYTYSVKKGTGNTFYVLIGLKNVSNQNTGFMPLQTQGMNMSIHMIINATSGYTTVTITPDFAAPITYSGSVSTN
ncbi:MAG: hypothetical protein RR980_05925 [Mucinivorans sp.]